MNSSDLQEPEQFYEYFSNRPTWFAIYTTFAVMTCVFGVIANLTIIIVKLRKVRELDGVEMIIINISVVQIIFALASVFYLVDEIYHDLTEHSMCTVKLVLHNFSVVSTGYFCSILIVSTAFFPNISKNHAISAILICYICIVGISYPYHKGVLVTGPMSNGKFRSFCVLFVSTVEAFKRYTIIFASLGYIIPLIIIITTSILSFFKKRAEIKSKQLILYSIIFSFYFILSSIYFGLIDLTLYLLNQKTYIEASIISKFFFTKCTVVHAIALFYVDQKFYQQCLQFLKLSSNNVVIRYVNIRKGRNGDTTNEFENVLIQ